MTKPETIIVVGGGLAGDTALATLRAEGYAGKLILVSEEKLLPYDRPPLSKDVLVNDGEENNVYLHPENWYSENQIDLKLGCKGEVLNADAHTLKLDSGEELSYDKLLIATGANVRRLPTLEEGPIPVYYMRTMDDSLGLRQHLSDGKKLVLVGGGVIGLEIAASARQRGCEVTVLEVADRVMARAVPASISSYLQQYHMDKGVEFKMGVNIEKQSTVDGQNGLLLEDGSLVPADVIVIGIGVVPNMALAENAGLECQDGIVVNKYAQTSNPDIYAVGDVSWYHDDYFDRNMRSENWMHAQNQAKSAVTNMIAEPQPYSQVPSVWSDQYDVKLQTAGVLEGEEILRGEIDSGKFMYFYLKGGVVVGAVGINSSKFMRPAQNIIAARLKIAAEQVADRDFNLKKALK